MTIEEKAKAYDKALKRAKAAIDIAADKDLVGGVVRTILPELAESEDEKIRKEINILYSDIDACITELLKARTDKDSESEGKALFKMEGLMVATLQDLSCIEDYLEKQKDQKDYNKLYEDIGKSEWFKKAYEGKSLGCDYEQKEQKPVSNPKWAELTWKDINELERIINNVHYEFQNGIGEDSFGELVLERFKEYKDDGSMDEQKPVEPSGKLSREEHLYQLLIDQLITYSDYEYLTGKNPAWSEEDEKRIKQLIYDTEAIRAGYEKRKVSLGDDFNDELIKDCDEQIKWLKSLRPSWKPSEHQMNILKAVKDYVGAGSGYWGEGLGSLIDDLEKLM